MSKTTRSSPKIHGQPDAKKRRDERAVRREQRARCREERSNIHRPENVDLQGYVDHIVYMQEGDIPEPPSTDFTDKSIGEKNIECGDLVWLGPRCTNVVGVVFSVHDNKAVVQLFTTSEWKVTTLNNSDMELKRKAKNTKRVEQFRRLL